MTSLQVCAILAILSAVVARDPRCPIQNDDEEAIFYPHERNCSKFYTCISNGSLVEMDCKDGLEFDTELSVCNWPNGSCVLTSPQAALSIVCTADQDGLYFPNYDDNCQSFFKCEEGTAKQMTCGKGLLFNTRTNLCDWEHNVKCQAQSSTNYILPNCQGVRNGTMFANFGDNCKSFFICHNEEPVKANCEGVLFFNPERQVCDWPQNVRCVCEGTCVGERNEKLPCFGRNCPPPCNGGGGCPPPCNGGGGGCPPPCNGGGSCPPQDCPQPCPQPCPTPSTTPCTTTCKTTTCIITTCPPSITCPITTPCPPTSTCAPITPCPPTLTCPITTPCPPTYTCPPTTPCIVVTCPTTPNCPPITTTCTTPCVTVCPTQCPSVCPTKCPPTCSSQCRQQFYEQYLQQYSQQYPQQYPNQYSQQQYPQQYSPQWSYFGGPAWREAAPERSEKDTLLKVLLGNDKQEDKIENEQE